VSLKGVFNMTWPAQRRDEHHIKPHGVFRIAPMMGMKQSCRTGQAGLLLGGYGTSGLMDIGASLNLDEGHRLPS